MPNRSRTNHTQLPARPDLIRLGVGVLGIGTSGPLIATSLMPVPTLIFWRNLGGALVTAPFAIRHAQWRNRHGLMWSAIAGVLLALHFMGFFLAMRSSFFVIVKSVTCSCSQAYLLTTCTPLVLMRLLKVTEEELSIALQFLVARSGDIKFSSSFVSFGFVESSWDATSSDASEDNVANIESLLFFAVLSVLAQAIADDEGFGHFRTHLCGSPIK